MVKANLAEVFSGIQGEGLFTGFRQLFIRFAGCNLRCRYCDTPFAQEVSTEYRWDVEGGEWKVGRNPISVGELIEIIKGLHTHCHSISLTGGEPLLQTEFITEFLSSLSPPLSLLPIYLETNGILPENLKKIVKYLDIIAADIKLPSSTGLGRSWEEHQEFLSIAKGCHLFVKVVVTSKTTLEDVERAVSLIKEVQPQIPLVLQPDTGHPPPKEALFEYERIAKVSLNEVRIIPQIHRLMDWR